MPRRPSVSATPASWPALVAIVRPIAGRLFDRQNYREAFPITALFPVAGWAIRLALNREPRPARLATLVLHV